MKARSNQDVEEGEGEVGMVLLNFVLSSFFGVLGCS